MLFFAILHRVRKETYYVCKIISTHTFPPLFHDCINTTWLEQQLRQSKSKCKGTSWQVVLDVFGPASKITAVSQPPFQAPLHFFHINLDLYSFDCFPSIQVKTKKLSNQKNLSWSHFSTLQSGFRGYLTPKIGHFSHILQKSVTSAKITFKTCQYFPCVYL